MRRPHQSTAVSGRLASLALLFAVGAYFAIGCTLTLEYIDEGQIIYPSWLVSLGAVPYHDFGHMYGPALFAVNGTLFRWFGPDLIVIRLSLVLLKTVTVGLAYLVSRHLASRAFAILACATLVAVWGTPVFLFNTPYANHYSLTLTLGALLCFLSLPRHFRLGCLLTGLCFGFAATFKQTAGIFGLAGFALFLILARDALEGADIPAGPPLPAWCVRSARLATLGGMVGLFVLYLWPRNTIWNVVALFTPLALTLGIATFRELRGPVRPGMQAGLWGIVYAAVGAACPVLGIGIYYVANGWLPQLLFDLVRGLPQKITWFLPFPLPGFHSTLLILLPVASFAAVGFGRSHLPPLVRTRSRKTMAFGLLVIALLVLSAIPRVRTPVLFYMRTGRWYGDVFVLWFGVPLVAVWLTGLLLCRSSPRDAGAWVGRRSAVLLVYCNAVTVFLLFYPGADLPHIAMGLPVFTPLWAFLMERFQPAAHGMSSTLRGRRYLSAGLVVALAVVLAAPSVHDLITMFPQRRADPTSLGRATGIRGIQPKFGEVAALVAYLQTEVPADRRLLVLTCEQTLYFLTGRRSALERDEFSFYLICTDQVSHDDARSLIDERHFIETLATERPVLLEGGDPQTDGLLRRLFAEVSRYIDAHYQVSAHVATYRVLTWAR